MKEWTYFLSNFVAVSLGLAILWRGQSKVIRRFIKIFILLAVIGLINTLAEGPAMRWGIWAYNDPKTLGITIWGAKLETYVYCILVPIAIGSAAIIFAEYRDKRAHAKRRS